MFDNLPIDPASKTMMYGGATTSVFGFISVEGWCAIGGFLVALVGLLIQMRQASRKKLEHEAAMRAYAETETLNKALIAKLIGDENAKP